MVVVAMLERGDVLCVMWVCMVFLGVWEGKMSGGGDCEGVWRHFALSRRSTFAAHGNFVSRSLNAFKMG